MFNQTFASMVCVFMHVFLLLLLRFITYDQCVDYYFGRMEQFLRWIVTEPSFAAAFELLKERNQVLRDDVKRPAVNRHIPKKYAQYLETNRKQMGEAKYEEEMQPFSERTTAHTKPVWMCF